LGPDSAEISGDTDLVLCISSAFAAIVAGFVLFCRISILVRTVKWSDFFDGFAVSAALAGCRDWPINSA
jgi:hypothetical protein